MPERELRRALGRMVLAFGAAHFLPAAFVWLSSGGPAPLRLSARAWSLFFYVHFIALVACGVGLQALAASRTKLFYGGPLIDFLIGVTGFMLLETFSGLALRGGSGSSWPALLPGFALAAYGMRLSNGRPLLGP